jgi:hypothetical protein
MQIIKINEEQQICYSIVLEPEVEDFQHDIIDAETIREGAHTFLEKYLWGEVNMNLMHRKNIESVKIIESFISPANFTWEGKNIKKGSWLMGIKVFDNELWKNIKSGKFSGFSIGGTGKRIEEEG